MTAVLVVVSGVLLLIGGARAFVWLIDRKDARLHAELRAAQLLADAQLEADIAALERAWDMQRDCNCEHCIRGRADAQEANLRG